MFRVGRLSPDHLSLSFRRQNALQEDVRIPVASDEHALIRRLFLLAFDLVANLTFQLGYVLIFAKPAAPVEVDDRLLLAAGLVDRHGLANVDIGRANDEVVE